MTKRAILERLEALERRVADLEARPRQRQPWEPLPWALLPRPQAAPLPDRWWDQLQGGTTSAESSGTV